MPTLAGITGSDIPNLWKGRDLRPVSGVSLRPVFEGQEIVAVYFDWGISTALEGNDYQSGIDLATKKALWEIGGYQTKPIHNVFDVAYAARTLIRPLIAEGATVVTRLRRDAKLFHIVDPPTTTADA